MSKNTLFVLTPGRSLGLISIDFSLKPLTDETGKVVLLIPEGREITDFKQMWEALEKSQERFRFLASATEKIYRWYLVCTLLLCYRQREFLN